MWPTHLLGTEDAGGNGGRGGGRHIKPKADLLIEASGDVGRPHQIHADVAAVAPGHGRRQGVGEAEGEGPLVLLPGLQPAGTQKGPRLETKNERC